MRSQNNIKFCSGKQVNLLVNPFDIFCFCPGSWLSFLGVLHTRQPFRGTWKPSAQQGLHSVAGFQFLQEQPGSISIQSSNTQFWFSATPWESYVAYVCPALRQIQGTQHTNIWGPLCAAFSWQHPSHMHSATPGSLHILYLLDRSRSLFSSVHFSWVVRGTAPRNKTVVSVQLTLRFLSFNHQTTAIIQLLKKVFPLIRPGLELFLVRE